MSFRRQFLAVLVFTMLLLHSTSSPTPTSTTQSEPQCTDVVIPVTVTAHNIYMDPSTTFEQAVTLVTNTLCFLVGSLFDELVEGTYDIAGTYCEPQIDVPSRKNTLQILQHGATYDRYFWSGDGPIGSGYNGTTYSWVNYFSLLGYPVFFFDRLGCGSSSHPDPILTIQIPTEVSILNSLISLARSGRTPFPQSFNSIVLVGHSLGSIIAQSLSVTYPSSADAVILTGYSQFIVNFLPGIFVTGLLLPAPLVQPSIYPLLSVGFLEASSLSGIKYLFWYDPYGNGTYYDPAFPEYDFSLRGTITVGEAATGGLAAATAEEFTGDVFVATGQQDTLFCGTTALKGDGPGKCVGGELNYLASTADLYPNANYAWYSVPDAGHCWQFHYSAKIGFEAVGDWLEDTGY